MNTYNTQLQPMALASDDDPWRYGWRYVQRHGAPAGAELERVPLTLEDVLHPEVGDFIVHSDRHETDRMYLTQVLRAHIEPNGQAIVLSDVRIAWDHAELRAHGPDVMVIPGLSTRQDWSTFAVAEEGERPALIIEITSPETRNNDLTIKVVHYALVGVAQYVIVDDIGRGRTKPRRPRLIGYTLVGDRYTTQACDEHGRLWLAVAQLWIGVRDDHVVCYDEQGNEIGDYLAVVQAADAAEARAVTAEARVAYEAQARTEAEARAQEAEARAQAATQARDAAEAQLQVLQAELRRLRGEE
ncbi:MAG: Uma2 family endonuclease [Candidatus Viridilinea halotolerans]|uniref:Uma2 family endonuclease n=1 Tax=Candidatus Viridilinea halotolerans TaxID=2491704 RepID=A0A426U079_9CHLR|nr:MAG: Uma2 family endonuclease [Candidatus Viridilinea halotolerans]